MRLMQRLAAVESAGSLSNRLRQKRFERFTDLCANLPRPLHILDFGGTPQFWAQRGWTDRDDIHITTVNLQATISPYSNITATQGNVLDLPSSYDQAFDIAFSNSVLEHLETYDNQVAMAEAMRRAAPRLWMQTPNYWFPMEPHFHVPGWQWLPHRVRVALLQRRRCGWRGPCPDRAEADALVREVRLLKRREIAAMFPGATIEPERIGGIVKSWIAHAGFDRAAVPLRTAA